MGISSAEREQLLEQAAQARQQAYAPYSGYPVGAAVLTGTGRIFPGANVENAAYPSGMCAERAAVFGAVSAGERDIRAVAVVTDNAGAPCGSCRQVLSEFGPEATVILADPAGKVRLETDLKNLLPHAFGPEDLPSHR